MNDFYGLGMNIGNLWRLSNAETRSICPENLTGEKGKGGMAKEGTASKSAGNLGQGWKINPFINIKAGETAVLADITGPGAIQHIWMTPVGHLRFSILRIYWDDSSTPSVECPVGDFFANGWNQFAQVSSLAVCTNPRNGFNCYWEMPFKKKCKITMTNISEQDTILYFQIDYILTNVPDDAAYFHAQFRRVNPLPYKEVYTILDSVKGQGQYVGTYMAWGSNTSGWWGEGEIKFYMDGDKEFPTICGTGTEDYFCGAYCFNVEPDKNNHWNGRYQEYSTPYAGMPQVIRPDGFYKSQTRFGLYRWHITDPIRFKKDLRITIQALGWKENGTYAVLQDDIASVAYWYQTLPAEKFPKLPDKEFLEVI